MFAYFEARDLLGRHGPAMYRSGGRDAIFREKIFLIDIAFTRFPKRMLILDHKKTRAHARVFLYCPTRRLFQPPGNHILHFFLFFLSQYWIH